MHGQTSIVSPVLLLLTATTTEEAATGIFDHHARAAEEPGPEALTTASHFPCKTMNLVLVRHG